MPAEPFDLAAYLDRIGLDSAPTVDIEGMAALHAAHVFSIPFENLDIMLGRGVDLAPEAIFDKLVRRRRGGYCFEHNSLFLMALEALGFEARPHLARVLLDPRGPGGRTHMVLAVETAGGLYLADVGFGGGTLRQPLPLREGAQSEQFGESFRLVDGGELGLKLQMAREGDWADLYAFTDDAVLPVDIRISNHYTSTSPEVHFTRMRIAQIVHPDGMTRLINLDLSVARAGQAHSDTLADGAPYRAALAEHFGIVLGSEADRFPPVVA